MSIERRALCNGIIDFNAIIDYDGIIQTGEAPIPMSIITIRNLGPAIKERLRGDRLKVGGRDG